jgi:hypothetical protein
VEEATAAAQPLKDRVKSLKGALATFSREPSSHVAQRISD